MSQTHLANDPHPFVSVIIPTFNDTDDLLRCLQALHQQTYSDYEVIVVNNNPRNDLSLQVQSYEKVRLLTEAQPSSYAARNHGIRSARGSVFAFTDADCYPATDWLAKGVQALAAFPLPTAVAGKIQVYCQCQDSPSAVELFDLLYGFPQETYVERDHYGATANLFAHRQVFEQVGLFDDTLQSGGDFEWGNRVFNAGLAVNYSSDVGIQHPARSSVDELVRKNRRIVRGHYRLMQRNLYSSKRFMAGLVADLVVPFRIVPKILLDDRAGSLPQRFQAASIGVLIRYVRGWQRLKLQLQNL
ncbi:MAG: glycosyltransferase family A protein [Cyanobacteria bacterium P01_B01_bin.77]